jgi:hypothetical protein
LGGASAPGWVAINDVRDWDDMDKYEDGDHIYPRQRRPDRAGWRADRAEQQNC